MICGGRLFWHDPQDDVATMAVSSSKTLSSLVSKSGDDISGDLTVKMLSSEDHENEAEVEKKQESDDDDDEENMKRRGAELRDAFYRKVAIMSGENAISSSDKVIGRFCTTSSNKTIDFTISKGKDGDVTTGHLKYIDLCGCEANFKSGEGANMIYIKGLKDEKRSNFKMRFEKESTMRQWFRAVKIGIEIANRNSTEEYSASEKNSTSPALSPSSSFRDAQIAKRIMRESVSCGHMTKEEYESMWFHEILKVEVEEREGKKKGAEEEEEDHDSEDSMDNEKDNEKYQLCVPVALVVVSNKILTETIRRRILRLPLRLLFHGRFIRVSP